MGEGDKKTTIVKILTERSKEGLGIRNRSYQENKDKGVGKAKKQRPQGKLVLSRVVIGIFAHSLPHRHRECRLIRNQRLEKP